MLSFSEYAVSFQFPLSLDPPSVGVASKFQSLMLKVRSRDTASRSCIVNQSVSLVIGVSYNRRLSLQLVFFYPYARTALAEHRFLYCFSFLLVAKPICMLFCFLLTVHVGTGQTVLDSG